MMPDKEEIKNRWLYKMPLVKLADAVDYAMQEYADIVARERAVGFANWIKENNYTKNKQDGWYQYFKKVENMGNYCMSTPVYKFTTEEQLYQEYLEQLNKEVKTVNATKNNLEL